LRKKWDIDQLYKYKFRAAARKIQHAYRMRLSRDKKT
jgi:hypothetical protein